MEVKEAEKAEMSDEEKEAEAQACPFAPELFGWLGWFREVHHVAHRPAASTAPFPGGKCSSDCGVDCLHWCCSFQHWLRCQNCVLCFQHLPQCKIPEGVERR